jgi:hypothetical protein
VEVFDFEEDDSVPEPLGHAVVLLKDVEPTLLQVNISAGGAGKVGSRFGIGACLCLGAGRTLACE